LFGDGLAWYSIDGSLSEFRQMAHVSAQMSQLHIVTAFHFLISNRGAVCPLLLLLLLLLLASPPTPLPAASTAGTASCFCSSAIVLHGTVPEVALLSLSVLCLFSSLNIQTLEKCERETDE
jgi:hypothetical protein